MSNQKKADQMLDTAIQNALSPGSSSTPPECQKCGMGMLVATKEQFAARVCGSCERSSTPPSPTPMTRNFRETLSLEARERIKATADAFNRGDDKYRVEVLGQKPLLTPQECETMAGQEIASSSPPPPSPPRELPEEINQRIREYADAVTGYVESNRIPYNVERGVAAQEKRQQAIESLRAVIAKYLPATPSSPKTGTTSELLGTPNLVVGEGKTFEKMLDDYTVRLIEHQEPPNRHIDAKTCPWCSARKADLLALWNNREIAWNDRAQDWLAQIDRQREEITEWKELYSKVADDANSLSSQLKASVARFDDDVASIAYWSKRAIEAESSVERLKAELLTPAEARLCLHVLETGGHVVSITHPMVAKLQQTGSRASDTGGPDV